MALLRRLICRSPGTELCIVEIVVVIQSCTNLSFNSICNIIKYIVFEIKWITEKVVKCSQITENSTNGRHRRLANNCQVCYH